jgi:hypothetical protein
MAYGSFAIGSGHMNAGKTAVWMPKVLIQSQGVIQRAFIGSLSHALIHGKGAEKKIDGFLVVHFRK